ATARDADLFAGRLRVIDDQHAAALGCCMDRAHHACGTRAEHDRVESFNPHAIVPFGWLLVGSIRRIKPFLSPMSLPETISHALAGVVPAFRLPALRLLCECRGATGPVKCRTVC